MEERFKAYLIEQFRQIAPTKAAMEYRKTMLERMLDRAQEIRIRGVDDEELIYNMVIGELGDFAQKLRDYENSTVKKQLAVRRTFFTTVISISYAFLLTLVFLIVGGVTHIWHPTWMILVGGVLFGLAVLTSFSAARCAKKRLFVVTRVATAGCIALLATLLFLIMQVVANVSGSWMVFLAMVATIAAADAVIAFASGNAGRWIELPIFAEVFCVMLYVILGVSLSMNRIANIWHPGWVMCLGGVCVAIVEAIVAVCGLNSKKRKNENKTTVDESYWTKW